MSKHTGPCANVRVVVSLTSPFCPIVEELWAHSLRGLLSPEVPSGGTHEIRGGQVDGFEIIYVGLLDTVRDNCRISKCG